ncbi:MAG: hypothetical protein ACOCXD_01665 [Bacteroidota bacterium]
MKSNHVLELSGIIRKTEDLISLDNNIKKGTLVLESNKPFPGYYHGFELPDTEKPRSIFLIIKNVSTPEEISRITTIVKKREIQHNCIANYAEIQLGNYMFPSIRVKNIDCFARISEIQHAFEKEGIVFSKHEKINQKGLIKLHKVFLLSQVEDEIYFDMDEHDIAYLKTNHFLTWPEFEKITYRVKNNLDKSNFDAATASFFRYHGFEELVRVYSKGRNIETLHKILKKYMSYIMKAGTLNR